jgi:hypothetical protein
MENDLGVLVDLTRGRWNRMAEWLKRLDALRLAA